MSELREELIQWVKRYQDAAERNALAETPEESADYLLTLMQPANGDSCETCAEGFIGTHEAATNAVRAKTLKEVAEWQMGQCSHGTKGAKTRAACALCQIDFNVAVRNGIMPGTSKTKPDAPCGRCGHPLASHTIEEGRSCTEGWNGQVEGCQCGKYLHTGSE